MCSPAEVCQGHSDFGPKGGGGGGGPKKDSPRPPTPEWRVSQTTHIEKALSFFGAPFPDPKSEWPRPGGAVLPYGDYRQPNEDPSAKDCHPGAIASKGREARKRI